MSQNWTPPPAGAGSATVPNYMVPAIISIFCCWPLAIPAIIFAAQVNNKAQAGDIAGAPRSDQRGQPRKLVQIDSGAYETAQTLSAVPAFLTGTKTSGTNQFRLSFTNAPGSSFSIWGVPPPAPGCDQDLPEGRQGSKETAIARMRFEEAPLEGRNTS